MYIASKCGRIEVVKKLLAYGADINEKNNVSTIYNMIICYVI